MKPENRHTALQIGLGTAVSVVLLALLFSGLDARRVWAALRGADPVWVVAVLLVHLLALFARVARWRLLLDRAGCAPPAPREPRDHWLVGDSMFFGWLGNIALPARLGELARPALYARRSGHGFPAVLGTLAAERAADLVVVVGTLAALLLFAPLPEHLPSELPVVARAFGGITVIGIVVLLALARPGARERGGRLGRGLSAFREGLGAMRSARSVATLLGWTVLIWGLEAGCTWVGFHAFSASAPWTAALLQMVAVTLSISVVTTPGGVGVEQAVTVAMLVPFGLAAEQALALSFVLTFGALFWLVPGGLLGMWRQGARLLGTVREAG